MTSYIKLILTPFIFVLFSEPLKRYINKVPNKNEIKSCFKNIELEISHIAIYACS